ncbi:hypothetical protein F2Q70_00030862 [Brassica cretica]|uniref:Uncharacterized protein n=1 Tax=Brassica cretica TaxID=69181 RepID=A0A8S9FJR9_BRACR|nr:hypothetical protein F2Q70_00030862 [Brassica cretica]
MLNFPIFFKKILSLVRTLGPADTSEAKEMKGKQSGWPVCCEMKPLYFKVKEKKKDVYLQQEGSYFEPSERYIGELSQPPSTEIRSVTPPPSHALGHQCVCDVETSPGQEFQPENRSNAPTRA